LGAGFTGFGAGAAGFGAGFTGLGAGTVITGLGAGLIGCDLTDLPQIKTMKSRKFALHLFGHIATFIFWKTIQN
jgi:hypothetical protein